jgi:hypothetical protein
MEKPAPMAELRSGGAAPMLEIEGRANSGGKSFAVAIVAEKEERELERAVDGEDGRKRRGCRGGLHSCIAIGCELRRGR